MGEELLPVCPPTQHEMFTIYVREAVCKPCFQHCLQSAIIKVAVEGSEQHNNKKTNAACQSPGNSFSLTDMAVQNFVGDAFRGATWVALHNGGGVGW